MSDETAGRDAEAALAVIRQEQAAVADRLNNAEAPGRRWILAGVMGAAVAVLLVDNGVAVAASIVIYLIGALVVMGIPVRAGVAPRPTRRELFQSFVAVAVLLAVHTVGVLGLEIEVWWLTGLAAVLASAVTVGMIHWKNALIAAQVARSRS
jgi:hypothetical protein